MAALEIKNLKIAITGNVVLNDLSLKIFPGKMHALIGKNGSGKSSLARVIAGDSAYSVLGGDIAINETSIIGLPADEIAKEGFFLAFQNPIAIPGVSVANFIRAALQAKLPPGTSLNAIEFYKNLYEKMELLGIDKSFSSRSMNDGFSGGEKKRCEVLQLLMLNPQYAIFDETDSGLDVDALKTISQAINSMRSEHFSAIIITHHNKLLEYIKPDFVHVLSEGKIVLSGGCEIIDKLEKFGYDFLEANSEDNTGIIHE